MGNKPTLWTINRAWNLLLGNDENRKRFLQQFGDRITLGQRTDTEEDPNQLMPSSEYFVPIVPKCIGSLFDDSSITGETKTKLNAIKYYYNSIVMQKGYKAFWENPPADYKMLTQKYEGYYSLLRKTAPNILVGYIQCRQWCG